MTIKQYLDLRGLTTYDTNIKNYIKDLKDVEAYSDLLNFPSEGKVGVLYMATDSKALYAWAETGYYRIGLNQETIDKLNVAYENASIALEHAQIKDGSNPHKTTYANIVNLPEIASEDDINSLINS